MPPCRGGFARLEVEKEPLTDRPQVGIRSMKRDRRGKSSRRPYWGTRQPRAEHRLILMSQLARTHLGIGNKCD